jgi:aldehyde dehydrogenase (NAD+)
MSRNSQAACGTDHLRATIAALTDLTFSEPLGEKTVLYREPIGVCALITPWNWPINQIVCKVAPALAAGCTMVLKPSELTPLSAQLFAEVLHEAGVPAGVFNMVHGDGPTVGTAMSSHPDVDMVSFTGSNAAPGIKRVAQELGGKSANIMLDDADFESAVPQAVLACMDNSGQSCNAPTRLLVPTARHDEVVHIAAATARAIRVGDPRNAETEMGPLVSKMHYEKVRGLIETGQAEGARLAAGGSTRFMNTEGYFVSPTIFGGVTGDMTIAQEEIFGPVLAIMPYRDEEDAIALANGTRYGLSAYVTSADAGRALAVGRRMRAGMVHINGAMLDAQTPFGGYRQSGNGREGGRFGIEEFTELKAVLLP